MRIPTIAATLPVAPVQQAASAPAKARKVQQTADDTADVGRSAPRGPVPVPKPAHWDDPAVIAAFREYLPQRWEAWKAAHEEADCKTTAAKMMEDFRVHYQESSGRTLASPYGGKETWVTSTAGAPKGVTPVVPKKGPVRPEYANKRGEALIDGPNHRILQVSAHQTALSATTNIAQRDGQALVARYKGQGDFPKGNWRINQDLLQPGDLIFQQHTHPNDTRWDHTMTVVGVERDAAGRATRLTMAIGSFDDVKDNNAATPPSGPINYYAYEQVIDFQDGEIVDSKITWQSDAKVRPIGEGEDLAKRIHRAQVILGAEQRLTEVHRWGK